MNQTISQPEASVTVSSLDAIQPFRGLFLQELNRQCRYNAVHERGRADQYLVNLGGRMVGYGSVNGQRVEDRDTVFEFYVVPPFRKWARSLLEALLRRSGARFIECQSHDPLLAPLLHELTGRVRADVVLFEDHVVTQHGAPGGVVRVRRDDEDVFPHTVEPVGEYVLEIDGAIVATGGFARHYNMPFADLFMEVRPDVRRKGYGSFLVQELKTQCYLAGRVPAARCQARNTASRATLVRAGLRESGLMLIGEVELPGG